MDRAKLFKIGQRQVVRLPEGCHLVGEEVFVKKVGNGVLLLPFEDRWQLMWDSLEAFEGDIFADGRNQPTEVEQRESFD